MDKNKVELYSTWIVDFINRNCKSIGLLPNDWDLYCSDFPVFPSSEDDNIKIYSPISMTYCFSENDEFNREIIRRVKRTFLNVESSDATILKELSDRTLNEINNMHGKFIICYWSPKGFIGQVYLSKYDWPLKE